jgi:hypothetical protein
MENTPHYIFDWIDTTPFDALNPAQRAEVLQYLTQQEYTQLHLASHETKSFFGNQEITNTDAVFASLSNRFDAVYAAPPAAKKALVPLVFWKVAASLLLVAVGYLSFLVYQKQPKSQGLQATLRDTVYITLEQPAKEVKIHDTVFINVPAKQPQNTVVKHSVKNDVVPEITNIKNWKAISPELNTLSITDINKGPNAPRNRSIQNDTFVKEFNYVSL